MGRPRRPERLGDRGVQDVKAVAGLSEGGDERDDQQDGPVARDDPRDPPQRVGRVALLRQSPQQAAVDEVPESVKKTGTATLSRVAIAPPSS